MKREDISIFHMLGHSPNACKLGLAHTDNCSQHAFGRVADTGDIICCLAACMSPKIQTASRVGQYSYKALGCEIPESLVAT